jgi:hypothetical protein
LELVLRIAASAQLALVLALLAARREDNKVYGYTSLLLLGIAGYLLALLVLFHWHWGMFAVPIILLATLIPVFFWYFACAGRRQTLWNPGAGSVCWWLPWAASISWAFFWWNRSSPRQPWS